MGGQVDAVVVGVGSGGTLGGLTKFFLEHSPSTEMVIADPVGSIIAPYINTGVIPKEVGSWFVEGIGEDFIPINADFSLVKKAYSIPDQESFLAARKLLATNAIMAGSSAGTFLAAALRYCKEQTVPKRVITFVGDSGTKYLSKMYNDYWMIENGFMTNEDILRPTHQAA
jgi:cystathionine beta-synthase